MAWFFVTRDRKHAEVPGDDLAALVRERLISEETLIWKEGMEEWTPARKVRPDLFTTGVDLADHAGPPPHSELPPPPPQATAATQAPVPRSFPPPQTPASGASSLPTTPTAPLAVWSLVLGILSWLTCLSLLTAVPGIICGHLALDQIKKHPGQVTGRSLAMAGLIISYLNVFGSFIMGFIVLLGGA